MTAGVTGPATGAPARRRSAALALAGIALLLAGCGGGTRQDAGETERSYRVRVLRASFPRLQSIARPTRMELVVRNAGLATIPNLAITVDSFTYRSTYPELADPERPTWVIEQGPGTPARPPVETENVSKSGGGETAYVNTWALGPLPPGRTQRYVWLVVPVKPGLHHVRWAVSAGLAGKGTARLAGGAPAVGHFLAAVTGAPPPQHVDPSTGKVVQGPYPIAP